MNDKLEPIICYYYGSSSETDNQFPGLSSIEKILPPADYNTTVFLNEKLALNAMREKKPHETRACPQLML